MVASLALLFVVLMILTVPLAFAMGFAATAMLVVEGRVSLLIVVQRIFAGTDSVTLLAVPFYIFAGNLMDEIGISAQLVRLARALVGHIRGSLGMVAVVSEYFFSGISGSTSADVSAIGAMLLPAMKRIGYRAEHAVSIVAAAASMGSLVPPSIGMIVLAGILELSVGALFVAGFLPAIAIALVIMVLIYVQARRLGLPVERRATPREIGGALKDSLAALMMPVIIFGGILGGVTTATEAGAIACLYGLLLGVVFYRSLSLSRLVELLVKSAYLTGAVMFLVGTATLFAWIMAAQQVPRALGSLIFSISSDPFVFLAMTTLIFVLIGMVLEGIPAMLILVPIFFPLAESVGIHPLHFAIVVYTAINIGIFIPPIGVCFLMAVGIGKAEVEKSAVAFMPYLGALLVGLIIVMTFPWLTLVLPEAAGLINP